MPNLSARYSTFSWISRWWRVLITGVVVCMILGPASVRAQLTFEWGTARHDTLYSTVEDCLGLLRLMEGFSQKPVGDIVPETLSSRLQVMDNDRLLLVQTAAQQCSQKFIVERLLAPDTLEINKTFNAFKLLYHADRSVDVKRFVDGWFAKIPVDKEKLRDTLRLRLLEFAYYKTPTNFDVIRHLADGFDKRSWWIGAGVHAWMWQRALGVRDTVEFNRETVWLLNAPKFFGDSLMKTPEWQVVAEGISRAQSYSQQERLLAALRTSTTRFLEVRDSLEKTIGLRVGKKPKNEIAKPILAEFWFPDKPSVDIPTRGKLTMVVALLDNECNPCWWRSGLWGRLARKFPEMDFILLTRTHGHYGGYLGALPPEEEARVIDSFHRKVFGFPGRVAVHQTKFWRIDETFDRRRIEEPPPNNDQYPTMGDNGRWVIIDRNGKILDPGSLLITGMDTDERYELLIRALLEQKQ